MNLGLGLIAADQYFKAGDERELRDQRRRRFEQDDQVRQAELSLLPDRTTAARSGYRVTDEANQTTLAAVPLTRRSLLAEAAANAVANEGRAARAPTEVTIANNDAQFRLGQQPTTQATAAAQQTLGLGQAQRNLGRMADDQETLDNQALIARDLSRFNVRDMPRAIAEKVRAGAISEAQAMPVVHATLADLVTAGDPGEIVRFVNTMAEARGGANAMKIGGVRVEGGNLVFQDATGKDMAQANGMRMAIPLAVLQAAKNRLTKTEFKSAAPGSTLYGIQNGQVVSQVTAPESLNSRAERQGPLERDVNFLSSTFKMPPERALQMLREAKTMPRDQFILRNIQNAKLASPNKSDTEIIQELSRQYDAATRTGGTGAAPSSTGTALSPQLRSLIGASQ